MDPAWNASALLGATETAAWDRAALAQGAAIETLMEAAGAAVAGAIMARMAPRPVLVVCGPGNNGGDGYVAARHLAEAGWPVSVAAGEAPSTAAARWARAHWAGAVLPLAPALLNDARLVIDGAFGAGLNRPIDGAWAALLAAMAASRLPVVAIDVPSGVSGDTGAVLGVAAPAALTVTFGRAKPGHYLLPGRMFAGELVIAPIGLPEAALTAIRPAAALNEPALWLASLPRPTPQSHKYRRGHVLIRGGAMTGAGRLAARAARRVGAGLVTVAAASGTLLAFQLDQPGLITRAAEDAAAFVALAGEPHFNALVLGPGNGVDRETRAAVLGTAVFGRAMVLDAGALSCFEDDAGALADALRGPAILTPHDGEFARLFPALAALPKPDRARAAAARIGAVLLLKGADTVIAAPDGRIIINANAPPTLATAGSGDVLAGIAAGLLAQGMPAFAAAAAAAWLHGAAAARFGPGLIAEDLPEALPSVFSLLDAQTSSNPPW